MSVIEQYLAWVIELLREVEAGKAGDIDKAARTIVQCVSGGGMLYAFGTGHAHLLAEEIFYRAGGMAKVYPMLDPGLMLHVHASRSTMLEREEGVATALLSKYPIRAGDVLLVISNSGRNAVPVNMAMLAKSHGAYVIALTSLAHSRQSAPRNNAGKRLCEVCDLVLDNLGTPGDAAIACENGAKVGATSTVIGAAILQAMMCRIREISLQEGKPIDFFVSSNVDGGDAVNDEIVKRCSPLIHCL